MRAALLLVLAACGGPMLGNVPHPNNGAVAGGAAAVAGAITLAAPDAAGRKPEKKDPLENARGTDVKESVPPDVFDRMDSGNHQPAPSEAAPPPPAAKPTRKGPLPKLPSPHDAVSADFDQDH